jgi:hypothetical protein
MKQQESSLEGAPIYVTANSLMNDDITLNAAIQIARAAGADGFELRRELLPPTMQANETQDIRSQLQTFPSPPTYSIPLPLCKQGRFEPEPLLSRPFRTASAPHPALAYLPPDAPRAIEFPLAGEHHEAVSTTLRTYIIWLRSGNFVA